MRLTFQERANLGEILPREGSWITLTTVRDIQSIIKITDIDIKNVDGILQSDGNISFNTAKDKEKEFTFNDIALKIIKDALLKLDKENKLTLGLMSLFEKFVK
jgi:hypothetical protein